MNGTDSVTGRFAQKRAIVTGASDKGIGGAIAESLATEGAELLLLSLAEPARLMKLIARRGGIAHWKHCDVTDPSAIQSCIGPMLEESELDILINSAGVEAAGPVESLGDADWHEILDVNLRGVIEMTRRCVVRMASGGVIVNISSALAFAGCAGFSIYSASKGGLNSFTQSLSWELAPRKIRVVGVAPGMVYTPMIHKHIAELNPQVREQIERAHPLGVGTPQDVADVVSFLASRAARWVTGVTIPVGWSPHYALPSAPFFDEG
ncbi:MAG: SDR family oxidoreductase [Pirellulaceae bacterium]|jgi:NAD(P)-dependent dehydrogenase (short-subunit alcohol dehydrogenase family)|nr:SDR family oxidoreductase [Pirellulaceae bacterium]MDP7018152.1 SDR family oxidoreductase [Pirellulaceae bacterium]